MWDGKLHCQPDCLARCLRDATEKNFAVTAFQVQGSKPAVIGSDFAGLELNLRRGVNVAGIAEVFVASFAGVHKITVKIAVLSPMPRPPFDDDIIDVGVISTKTVTLFSHSGRQIPMPA